MVSFQVLPSVITSSAGSCHVPAIAGSTRKLAHRTTVGEDPIGGFEAECYLSTMNLLLLLIVLLLLCGGGGFYLGGPAVGSGGLGLVLLVCLLVYLLGGFRPIR